MEPLPDIHISLPEEAPAIAALWNDTIRNTTHTFTSIEKTEADVLDLLKTQILLTASTPKFAGFATFGPFRAGPGYAHTAELSIYLTPQAQGCGIAQALLDRLESVATGRDICTLIAGISSSNPRALGFFKNAGYSAAGCLKGVGYKSGEWLDLHLLQKSLPAAI